MNAGAKELPVSYDLSKPLEDKAPYVGSVLFFKHVIFTVTLLLILPHLGWQSGHDWVSFRYHLAGRNKDFQFSFVTEYLLNLLAIFNPLLFPVFVAVWWKTRAETPVLRALNFMSAGFVLFFLSTTLRGYVQPQWEIPVAFGVIALLFLHARRGGRPRRGGKNSPRNPGRHAAHHGNRRLPRRDRGTVCRAVRVCQGDRV